MKDYERFIESQIKPLKMCRKAIGVELKKTYFDFAARNAESAELENSQIEMFT